jgi:hypothetical protein
MPSAAKFDKMTWMLLYLLFNVVLVIDSALDAQGLIINQQLVKLLKSGSKNAQMILKHPIG